MSDAALPHEHPRSAHPWYRSAVFLGLLLILATTLLYSNTLHGKFLYDDYGDILDNPSIRQLWPLKDVFFGNIVRHAPAPSSCAKLLRSISRRISLHLTI